MFSICFKRLAALIIALLVTIMASDFIIHQILLQNDYAATAEVWRTPEQMAKMGGLMALGSLLLVCAYALIYALGFARAGWKGALTLSSMFFLASMSTNLMFYVVLPLPVSLIVKWSVASLLQCVLMAIVARFVYCSPPHSQVE